MAYTPILFNQTQRKTAKMLTTSIAYQDFCFSTLDDEKLSADIALGDDRLPRPDGRVEVDKLNVPSLSKPPRVLKGENTYRSTTSIRHTHTHIYIYIYSMYSYSISMYRYFKNIYIYVYSMYSYKYKIQNRAYDNINLL